MHYIIYTNEYLFNCFGNSFSTLFVKILKSAHFGPQIFFHSKNDLIYATKLFQLMIRICTDNLKILQDSKINLIGQKIREIFCKSIYVVKNFALRPHFWIKFLTISHCASLQMPTYVTTYCAMCIVRGVKDGSYLRLRNTATEGTGFIFFLLNFFIAHLRHLKRFLGRL